MLQELNIANIAQYFYKLAEKSQDVFWVRGREAQTHLYVSPACESVWGLPRDLLYKDPEAWVSLVVPEDRGLVLAMFQNKPQHTDSCVLTYRIAHPDKQIRWIQDTYFALVDANQVCIGYAGVAKDVTHERQRLAELEEASRFFRFFAEKIKSVFWVRDPKCNKQLYVSPAYEKVWGRSCENLYKNPTEWEKTLISEDQRLYSASMRLQQLTEKGPEIQYEDRYRIMHPEGGVLWIKDTSFPIYDDQNEFIGFAGIAEDITKDVVHELELRKEKQLAEMANQAKSDFLAMMSHELRTPLNAILGMAEIMQSKNIPPELADYVTVISQASISLLSLVNDILDFAKLEVGRLSFSSEPVDLRVLISQVIHSFLHQAKEKKIQLDLDFADEIPYLVVSDAKRIRQILTNLIGNAVKFTENGLVLISVNCLEASSQKATLRISVKDTGIGIQSDKLDFIFEKFSQLDSTYHRKYQGAGLGLAISKELVEHMGGNIQVVSEVGKGSEFSFTLTFPLQGLALTRPVPTQENPSLVKPQCCFDLRVLLVEDNSINQRIAKIMLEEVGCRVDIIDAGEEVLQWLEDLIEYDLIFMDIGLPDVNGYEVVKGIRSVADLTKIPIIAMTAHVLERDRKRCTDVGMNDVIEKPLTRERLIATLAKWSIKPSLSFANP